MKHSPATPLPWTYAEYVRRAKAYPRLVAEIKRLCVEIPRMLGSNQPIKNDLLRELGETE